MQTSLCGAILNSLATARLANVGTSPTQVSEYNPDKVAIMFGRAASDYFVFPSTDVSTTVGIPVRASGDGPVIISIHELGEIARKTWFAVAAAPLSIPIAESFSNGKG